MVFSYHPLPPIKTALLPLHTKIFTVHKGIFFSCCFSLIIQGVEQNLSFREGKGATSELGGSHHWRGTHGKINSTEKISLATTTCRVEKHTLEESNCEASQVHGGILSTICLWYILAGQSPSVLLTRGFPLSLSSCLTLNPLHVEEQKALAKAHHSTGETLNSTELSQLGRNQYRVILFWTTPNL